MSRSSSARCSLRCTVVAAVVGLAAVGCGDDGAASGIGGGGAGPSSSSSTTAPSASTGAGGAGTCGPLYGLDQSAECDACMNDACCDALSACAGNEHCERISRCWEHCDGDPECTFETCPDDAYDTPLTFDVRICQTERCAAPCGLDPLDCSVLAAPVDAVEPAACDACLASACCDELQEIAHPEATRFEACLLGCLDGACLRACENAHPEGFAALTALQACVFGICGADCRPEGSCGFAVPANACGDCHAASCCDATWACSLDVGCIDLAACTSGSCTTLDDCDVCLDLWPPDVVGLLLAGNGCLGAACGDVCNAPACGRARPVDDPGCEECLEGSCCAEASACGREAGCVAHEVCLERCAGDADCASGCAATHPDGAALFAPLAACAAAACAAACPDPLR